MNDFDDPRWRDDAVLRRLAGLFARHGDAAYEGARREAVSARDHALQCAELAQSAGASDALVAASLLHDVGHLAVAEAVARNDRLDDRHEDLAAALLEARFGEAVIGPIRLHVAAKRYLVRVDPCYVERLSPASVHSLRLQGGPMTAAEAAAFESMPWADDAVRLRRWDDLAKTPGRAVPPLQRCVALLARLPAPVRRCA